jgi:3-oxoacyl-[acyl-carrier protein] reductase
MKKTVFITGGSRGIGASAVKKFHDGGYNVAYTYFNTTKENLPLKAGKDVLPIKVDVRSSSDVKKAISLCIDAFGSIDVLINNAGISEFSLFTDITDEAWDNMLRTNLTSAFYTSKSVLPHMINKKSGVILNVSSMWGEVGASCEVHYSVSKAGLIGLTKALAKEVGPSGIRVNCVSPGLIETDMTSNLSDEDKECLIDETPLARIGKPIDIANTLYYLASDEASFITGQVIGVNGGFII